METDLSVPARKRGWWYFTRTVEGSQYAIHCRVAATDTGDLAADWTPPAIEAGVPIAGEQVLLDGNREAEGKPFFSLGGMAVSEDGNLLAYAQDNAGDERFTLRIKDLATGELLPDEIENVFYGLAFSPDGTRVFYTVVDDSWRPHQIKAHILGTDPATDAVVFQEDDPGMWLGFDLSADRTELLISIGNSEYSETRTLDLLDEHAVPVMLVSREHRILHSADPVTLDGRARLRHHPRPRRPEQHGLAAARRPARPALRTAALGDGVRAPRHRQGRGHRRHRHPPARFGAQGHHRTHPDPAAGGPGHRGPAARRWSRPSTRSSTPPRWPTPNSRRR